MSDSERSGKILSVIGIVLSLLSAGYFFPQAFAGNSQGDVLLGVLLFAGSLLIAVALAANLLPGRPCHDFVFSLLSSRTMLKKAPPLIARIENLLQRNEPDSALLLAENFYAEHPDSPALALLIARIRIDFFNTPEPGLAVLRQYFDRRKIGRADEHSEMVLYYSDQCEKLGMTGEAIRFLQRELERKNTYSAADRQSLRQRLDSLSKPSP